MMQEFHRKEFNRFLSKTLSNISVESPAAIRNLSAGVDRKQSRAQSDIPPEVRLSLEAWVG